MQDNAPCHTTSTVKQFFEEQYLIVMKWPAQSPDLNPIENLWKIIGETVMARKPTNVADLWQKLQEEWNKITPEQCAKLVASCGQRCAQVIQNKGIFTSY